MSTENITESNLAHFYGSERIYQHWLAKWFCYTEGVKFLADNGAAWLIDLIASHQPKRKLRMEEFQVWTLKRTTGDRCVVVAEDGNGNHLCTQRIEFTDFPLPEFRLYCERGDGRLILMLPSER